jgi:hypothetical protein
MIVVVAVISFAGAAKRETKMWTLITAALLGVSQEAEVVADASQDLLQLCSQMQSVQSYAFSVTREEEGSSFGGRGSGGRGEADSTPLQGRFQKGQPLQLQAGELIGYRVDEQLVYPDGQGDWQSFDPESMARGFGRGRGGDEHGEGGEHREGGDLGGGSGSDPRRTMTSAFRMRQVVAPHEFLSDLSGKLTNVSSAQNEHGVQYTAEFTPEAAAGLASSGARRSRGMRGRGREGAAAMNLQVTLSVQAGADGRLTQLTLATTMSGSFGEREFSRSSKSTTVLSGWGETKVEVPVEALAHFEL